MEITEVHLSPVKGTSRTPDNLNAYASLVFDNSFAVHDLRVIQIEDGFLIAMPSQRRQVTCRLCQTRVPHSAKYCMNCGKLLPRNTFSDRQVDGRMFRDLAHPITSEFRAHIQKCIVREMERLELA